jgi:hypothetical protein
MWHVLSQGLVQLVVVVDVKHKSGGQDGSMVLESITWAHWGITSRRWILHGGDLEDPQPDRDVDEDCVQPRAADAYKAVIEMDGKKYHLRASKVK